MTSPLRQPDFARAEAAAFRITKNYGCLHPADIKLEDLAWDRGVTVSTGVLVGSEGRLIRKGRRGLIRVRASENQIGRRRFSIAHELGHWELHQETQWIVCSSENLRDYKTSPLEAEANTFAADLLTPAYLVR